MEYTVEYRSGHNGVALKASVRVKTPVGSNPTSTAKPCKGQ